MKKIEYLNFRCYIALILISLSACSGESQSNDIVSFDEGNKASHYNANIHSDKQVGPNIFEIFEDSNGHIWFGTDTKGVARFDGQKLDYLTQEDGLCGTTVESIIEYASGKLWFGTHSDMCRYDLGTDTFTSFPKTDSIPMLGWGWKNVRTNRNGEIWVNTHQGIFQYKDDSFVEFEVPINEVKTSAFCSTPGHVSMELLDSQGNIWFRTDGDGAYKYDGNSFIHFTKEDGLPSNNVVHIIEDELGNVWFSCTDSKEAITGVGGLGMYDGKSFKQFKDIDGLYDNDINTIYLDSKGDLWIGATGVGLYQFNGVTFKKYLEPTGVDFTSNYHISGLQSILEDSQGRLWLGYSGGLFRLEGNRIINVTKQGPW